MLEKKITVIPQGSSLNLHLNAYDNIRAYLILGGFSLKSAKRHTDNAIDKYDLKDHTSKMSYQLSGGLKKRVQLARAMVSDAKIVFLDEPTTGLDPHSRRITWEFIKDAKKAGKTIFLTTQSMEEAEKLCDRVCFMNRGNASEVFDLKTLKSLYGNISVTITLETLSNEEKNLLNKYVDGVKNVEYTENVLVANKVTCAIDLIYFLRSNGYSVDSILTSNPSLEDIYFEIMRGSKC